MAFRTPSGTLTDIFFTEADIILNTTGQEVWTWGYNIVGSLGDNTTASKSSPVQTIAGGSDWKKLACGYGQVGGIKSDGTLWMWGLNNYGQLGDSTIVSKSSPIQTVSGGTDWKSVWAGGSYPTLHTAAIKTDGTLWTWGRNSYGQLGDNTLVSKSSPVQTVAGGNNWKQAALGGFYTAVLKTDGTIWSMGRNTFGQLGIGSISSRSSPVQEASSTTNWTKVGCGYAHTGAIRADGALFLWGLNLNGQLGDNTTSNKSVPVGTISSGFDWASVACGYQHTAAIKTDGTLWTWGVNTYGQLGDNTTTSKSSPVQTIAGGTDWKQVECGRHHTLAIKTDGSLWLWGDGSFGALGDNTTASKSSPVQTVAGGTNWRSIYAGYAFSAALRYPFI